MKNEINISLEGLTFYCYHGLHKEERLLGGEFEVDFKTKYLRNSDSEIVSIDETVDYEKIYEIIKLQMMQPQDLLENVALSIIQDVRKQFPQLQETSVCICKKNPPIINFTGKVSVTVN